MASPSRLIASGVGSFDHQGCPLGRRQVSEVSRRSARPHRRCRWWALSPSTSLDPWICACPWGPIFGRRIDNFIHAHTHRLALDGVNSCMGSIGAGQTRGGSVMGRRWIDGAVTEVARAERVREASAVSRWTTVGRGVATADVKTTTTLRTGLAGVRTGVQRSSGLGEQRQPGHGGVRRHTLTRKICTQGIFLHCVGMRASEEDSTRR